MTEHHCKPMPPGQEGLRCSVCGNKRPPAPAPDPEQELLAIYPVLSHFRYDHLPPKLQDQSSLFCALAWQQARDLPHGPEVAAGLRKLLEAKDCMVRAAL